MGKPRPPRQHEPGAGPRRAVEALKNGHVDLISGNHHNLYARRAKNREDFVHWPSSVTVGRKTTHRDRRDQERARSQRKTDRRRFEELPRRPHVWLFMRQEGLDWTRETTISWKRTHRRTSAVKASSPASSMRLCRPAAQSTCPQRRSAGNHRAADADDPRCHLATTMAWVKSHEEETRLLIRGTVEAVHFFLTQPKRPSTS